MWKALKNVGFFLVTIIITAAIFWLVFIDKESKQDVLEYSLGLLGEKLMAMVPDTPDKKPVEELYADFFEKAKKKEVVPEKIEHVAAMILNLSNVDTVITAKEAEAILKLSLAEPVRIEQVDIDTFKTAEIEKKAKTPQFVFVASPPKPPKGIPPEEWKNLGERIKSAYEFNIEAHKALKEQHKKFRQPHIWMKYRVDDGLRIAIDANLKHQLDQKEYPRLQKEMRELEQERIIVWRKNFQEEMQKEMEHRRQELESLRYLKEQEHLKALQGLEALKSLESLKNLEALQDIPVMNADSIRMIVEKSLKEAGVYQQGKSKK